MFILRCVGIPHPDPWAALLAEMLDGLSSGLIGVATPVLVADLAWNSGRTQTAIGLLNTSSGIGGALSGALAARRRTGSAGGSCS